MRPIPGNDAWSRRQRPATHRDTTPLMASSNISASNNSHMSFVFADEATVDSYIDQSNSRPRFRDPRKTTSLEFGNASRTSFTDEDHKHDDDNDNENENEDEDDDETDRDSSRPTSSRIESEYVTPYSPMVASSTFSHSPASMISHQPELSRPITPMMLGTSVTGSALSGRSSRNSFTISSVSEHAVSSDEEEEEDTGRNPGTASESGNAPQLIMPSINMPSRRPFTTAGKSIGRLKVLVAGDSGVGKTSLIKSIVQACEHIVHVDPIGPPKQISTRISRSRNSRVGFDSKAHISEIFASTKPYPDWWGELDEAQSSRRRKSFGDSVLERNICFVDTPGYGNGLSAMETIIPCVEYVESHLDRMSSDTLSEPDMLNMLGGGGGFQVDAVLYLILNRLKPADLEYMRRLAHLTNVIPILAQTDKFSSEHISTSKTRIASQLRDSGVRVFSFVASQRGPNATPVTIPYAVSSAAGSDRDVIDASLLMSSDYVKPLVPTELAHLVENIFSTSGTSWLRHAAAKKYLQWRNTAPSRPRHLYRPLNPPDPEPTRGLTATSGALIERPSLAVARTYDFGPVDSAPRLHLVDWAADLQRSLASERARFETLARGEQEMRLTGRLNEYGENGMLVPLHELRHGKRCSQPGRGSKARASRKTQHHQDPLGLLQVYADLKIRGWMALELLGSLSVLGGLAFWLSKHKWQFDPVVFADERAKVWILDF